MLVGVFLEVIFSSMANSNFVIWAMKFVLVGALIACFAERKNLSLLWWGAGAGAFTLVYPFIVGILTGPPTPFEMAMGFGRLEAFVLPGIIEPLCILMVVMAFQPMPAKEPGNKGAKWNPDTPSNR